MDSSDFITLLKKILRRPVAYHGVFTELAGKTAAGVMLSQAWYWTLRTDDEDGWFYKTRDEWREETAMSRTEQETSRRLLIERGLLQEKLSGMPARMHYRVDIEKLVSLLVESPPTARRRGIRQPDGPLGANMTAEKPPTTPIYTKTTSENTAKTTSRSGRHQTKKPVETKQQIDAIIKRNFAFWQQTFKHVIPTGQYTLTKSKHDMLRDRILGPLKPTEQDLEHAWIAILNTPFNMGKNDRGEFYCKWNNAFYDDDTLEKRLLHYKLVEGKLQDMEAERISKSCQFCEGSGEVFQPPRVPEGLTPVPESVWQTTLATISAAVDRDTFETWFKPVSCAGVNCTAVYLTVADKITHEWIAANHSEALFVAIAQAFGKAFQVEWLVGRMVQCTHGVPLR